jgi:hypothetical protein
MSQLPFNYGVTVSNKLFTDRKQDAEKLYSNLVQGINTTIISPRRWGKSSLVEKVLADISSKEKGVKTVMIDMFTVYDEESFLEIFSAEIIKASSTKFNEWVDTAKVVFKKLIPQINLGSDPYTNFSLSFNLDELRKHKEEILDLPEKIAQQKNIKIIIALDEFQNLASFDSYDILEKKMRAVWQRQKNVTYCLFGSKRHMMTRIFNNASKPFYRFGDIMILKKIERSEWVKFIQRGFKRTGKQIGREYARLIATLMNDHSWYVQQFSHYVWQKTETTVDTAILKEALQELINANMPLFQKEVESLSVTQLALLQAVAAGENQLTSTYVMQKYKLGTPRNVSKNKTILINNDIIDFDGKDYEFLDPVFELWFRKMFFKQDYLSLIS